MWFEGDHFTAFSCWGSGARGREIFAERGAGSFDFFFGIGGAGGDKDMKIINNKIVEQFEDQSQTEIIGILNSKIKTQKYNTNSSCQR